MAEITVPEVNYSNCKTIETQFESLLGQLADVSASRDANQRQLNEALQGKNKKIKVSLSLVSARYSDKCFTNVHFPSAV